MSKRITIITSLAVAIITAVSLSALRARDAAPSSWPALERNYAAANLELAEARLALAESQKQSVADSVSRETLDALQAGVRLANNRLAQLDSGKAVTPFLPQAAVAQYELQGLEAAYAKSLEANKLAPGSVSEFQLRNQAAELKAARARFAVLEAIGQQPADVRVQWQIADLQDEIRALWARPLIED